MTGNTLAIRRPTTRGQMDENLFGILLGLLLIASSNIGLLNVRLALKAPDGGNLLGPRDFLFGLIVVLGLLVALRQSHTALHNPLAKITFIVACLSPIAALVGLLKGGQALSVARELVMMSGWLLAYVVGTHMKSEVLLHRLWNAVLWLGLLVALGVFVEAVTAGELRVVTPADVVAETRRSTPSGFPIMMMAASLAMTQLFFKRDGASSFREIIVSLFLLLVILDASLLTQSRTLLVGLAAGLIAFLFMAIVTKRKQIRRAALILVLAMIPVAVGITFLFGERLLRADFADFFVARYSILGSASSLVEYSEVDTRRAEIELGLQEYIKSPVLGLGLASPYREQMYLFFGQEDPAIFIHNVFAFFLFRYGPLGLLLFLLLCVRLVVSLYRAFLDKTDQAIFGVGFAAGLINLVACSFFGSVFSSTYGVPVAMVCVGALIAYEEQRLRRQVINKWGEERCVLPS